MKKLLLFVLLALGAFVAPANAQQGQALIVSTCGSQSLNAATYGYLTMDTTGKLCDSASGGGGGGGTSSAFAAAFPATGTAIGVKNGANMVNLTADGSSNLNVNCAAGCAGGTTSNAGSGVATSSTNGASVSYLYGFNSTTWDQLQVDGGKRLQVTGTGGTFPVTGAFFQATQPVSNAGTFAVQAPITSWAGGTLGAMANYGTSPGAVLVPGVNASITNTPTVTANAGTNLNTSTLSLSATQGTTADAPATVPTTTTMATEIALLKAVANAINTGTASLGGQTAALSLSVILNSQYPVNSVGAATPVTATATGTTAATAATLAATASVTNYICGFTITADATALATGTATVSGTISGSLSYLQTIVAVTSGTSQLSQSFSPCIPASAANTAITVTSAAAGTGGNTIVNVQGYRL